jgi:hypothetical protein
MAKGALPFFMDNCVADSVGKALQAAGHDVVFLRDCMPTDTKDPVVVVACTESARILVSHDKDFKQIAKTLSVSKKKSKKLHRIALCCPEPAAAARIKEALSLIEWEWSRCGRGKTQLSIEITNVAIKVWR